MEYRIEDSFDVSPEGYWATFYDEAYTAALYKALDIGWELLELERKGEADDLVIVRRQKLTPNRDVPKLIEKFVKGAIAYTETSHFTARDNKTVTKTVPTFAADKIDNHGVYRLERLGDNKVNRIWEGHCSCSVPLVGGKIEKYLVEEIRDSYRRATDFTRKWIADHR